MKKTKKGFTLAEILVALGVIGVISALTIPTIANSINKAKVGPTLAKAIAQIEAGNKNIINVANSQPQVVQSGALFDRLNIISLPNIGISNPPVGAFHRPDLICAYWDAEGISSPNDLIYQNFDGTSDNNTSGLLLQRFNFFKFKNLPAEFAIGPVEGVANMFQAISANVDLARNFILPVGIFIDINGWNTRPNTVGKDIFAFQLQNNGLLTPYTDTDAGDYAQQIIDDGFKVTYY